MHMSLILHCIADFDLPECGSLPSSFSQGPIVAGESINASVASYHGVPGVDMAYSTADHCQSDSYSYTQHNNTYTGHPSTRNGRTS